MELPWYTRVYIGASEGLYRDITRIMVIVVIYYLTLPDGPGHGK